MKRSRRRSPARRRRADGHRVDVVLRDPRAIARLEQLVADHGSLWRAVEAALLAAGK